MSERLPTPHPVRTRAPRKVAIIAGLGLLASGCGSETGRLTSADSVVPRLSSAEAPATPPTPPPPATTTPRVFKALVGIVAHTENAAGVKEGTWTYKGPGDTTQDREKVRVVGDGSTVQILCHEKGRTIPLSKQSPGLGIPETNDWLRMDTPPSAGPESIPDVFVDTQAPVPEC